MSTPEGLSGEILKKYAPTGAPKKPLPWIVQVRFLEIKGWITALAIRHDAEVTSGRKGTL
ncbi:hypothetical protein QZM99_05930 [Burkholderia gladioli]|uniref:hypothetical protein n=1 Tax=Burkholderia gladioli TaxID=28095 RepID=UPI0026567481|nr:hypothetical protein [Burkholderia gladioli]MDN7917626.1 hypothetical protein [Burkholderia gladioli]